MNKGNFQGAYSQRYSNYTSPSEKNDSIVQTKLNNTIHTVKVAFDGDMGDVTGTSLVNGVASVHSGDSITLTATPKAGYRFVQWIGAPSSCKDTNETVSFNVLSDRDITAIFAVEETAENPNTDPEVNVVPVALKENQLVTLLKKYWWVLAILLGYYLYKEGKLWQE